MTISENHPTLSHSIDVAESQIHSQRSSDCPTSTQSNISSKSSAPNLKQTLLCPALPQSKASVSNPYASTSNNVKGLSSTTSPRVAVQTELVNANPTDHAWIGHRMRRPRPSYARFWIQNVHGLNISYNFNPYLEHLDFIKRYNIQFLALIETHLNHQNQYVKENIEASHKMIYPEGHVVLTNTPTNDYDDTRKSGGILISTQGRLSQRYAGGGCDPGGRYAWMDFYGKEVYLRIYTVYRVCPCTDSIAGDNQAWTLQREWLQAKGVNENPRSQILLDLKKAIQSDIHNKREVMVVGDFNENVLGATGKTVQMMKNLGLINVISDGVVVPAQTRTFCRGSTVIDGIWASSYINQKIISCGLAPFDFLYPSDHRGIFFDVDILEILDARDIDVQLVPYRRLKCTIPKRVTSYCDEVKQKWKNHKIKEKLNKLVDMSTVIDDPTLYQAFERYLNQYDAEIGGILSSSERHCCQVSRHCSMLFTPKLQKILRTKRQLQQQISKKKKLQLTETIPNCLSDLKHLQSNLVEINQELRAYEKNQREKRDEFLTERAEDLCKKRELPKSKVAAVAKNLKHIEKQILDANMIRKTLKASSKSRTDFVMIPALSQYTKEQQQAQGFDHMHIDTIWPRLQLANGKDIVEWYDVEDPILVEKLILEALQKHFSQASDTLITTEKWKDILSSKKGQEDLLNGNIKWDDSVPSDFRELLSTFKTDNSQQNTIPFSLSYEAFMKFIQNSKEKTSTSPSSRHYGHYKSLLESAPDELYDIFRLMKLSVDNGIFLNRYKKTLTTLICKESGTPYLHRFRPIHIIEAELQFISKSIWAKKMIYKAELDNKITDAQYGGRHGRQAQSSVLNTILYYDIHRQLRKNFTSNDDDMKANFDREIPHYVAAETRSIGMSHEAGKFLIQATSSQEYYIRTQNGPSATHYAYSNERPIWGLGQGVGWAGACWQITASTISKCMNENCTGMYLCCPEGKIDMNKLMDFFIDDTKKICNQMKEGMNLREQTQFNMQKHTYYIATTGGSLALDKCTWYQVHFSFDANGDPFILNKRQLPGEIEVFKNFGGEKVRIKRLDFDEAHRSLGYFVSPDGNVDAHYEFTSDLVHKWKAQVMSSRLNSSQIMKSYDTVLKRQLLYRLVATSFTYDQCDELMKKISPILLHAANVQEHFPRAISEAGETYAGLNFTHLYDLHGQEKLQFFMMHIRNDDTTGKLLNISLKYTQMQLGIDQPFLTTDYEEYSYLGQATWITHMWEYVSSRGIQVDLTEPGIIPMQRQNDAYIMNIVHNSTLSKRECVIVNKVRIALQLLHLSDIVDGTGRRLLPDVRNAKIHRSSLLHWPKQVLLPKWMPVWYKACGILQRYVSGHCLGRFIGPPLQTWEWTADASHAYITNGKQTYVRRTSKSFFFYAPLDAPLSPEVSCNIRVDLSFHKGRPKPIYIYDQCQPPHGNGYDPTQRDIQDFENMWNTVFGDWTNVISDEVEEKIVDGLCRGEVIIGLDGSVTDGCGAYSFGFFTPQAEPIYLYHGPVHGDKEQQNSTRSEMHGILGAVLFLRHLKNRRSFPDECAPIRVLGDNLESLRVSREGPSTSLKHVFSSDMDVAFELYSEIKKSFFTYEFEHVKAHQDDVVGYDDLSIEAKINVQCDEFVSKYFVTPMDGSVQWLEKIPHYPNQKVSLSNLFTRITSSYRSNINRYKIGHEAEHQCSKTWKISIPSLHKLDWLNLRKEYKSRRGANRFRMTKAIHRQWPLMTREKKWNRASSALCPLCKHENETLEHIYRCKNVQIQSNRSKLFSDLKKSLKAYKTSPILINHILRMMYQFCGGHRVSKIKSVEQNDQSTFTARLSQAIQIQCDDLGIQNMLLGLVTPVFTECQRLYYRENSFGKNYSADRWGRWLVREMIDFSLSVWKFRCDMVHEKCEGSMEQRLRSLAEEWLIQLRQNQTLIPLSSRHLLNRSPTYFRRGALRSVTAWIRRIDVEMQKSRETPNVSDIRKWMISKNDVSDGKDGSQNRLGTKVSESLDVEFDDESGESIITDCVVNSVTAVRDLLLETDTIVTFPFSKHDCNYERIIPIPDIISVRLESTNHSFNDNQNDRYAHLVYKKLAHRRFIDEDSSTTDSEDSVYEVPD